MPHFRIIQTTIVRGGKKDLESIEHAELTRVQCNDKLFNAACENRSAK